MLKKIKKIDASSIISKAQQQRLNGGWHVTNCNGVPDGTTCYSHSGGYMGICGGGVCLNLGIMK